MHQCFDANFPGDDAKPTLLAHLQFVPNFPVFIVACLSFSCSNLNLLAMTNQRIRFSNGNHKYHQVLEPVKEVHCISHKSNRV
jgi:hypothetical protein